MIIYLKISFQLKLKKLNTYWIIISIGNLKKRHFHGIYYDSFIFYEKYRGEVLFNEREELKYIYFIKEGEIEYTMNQSLTKLLKLTKSFCKRIISPYNHSNNEEEFIIKHKTDKAFQNQKQLKLFTSVNEQIVGLLEFLYKIPNNFQAKVVSKELKYYILPIEKFKEIYDSNENMKNYFDNLVLTKMKWRIERFYEIRNLNFELIKNNAQKEEKERRNSLFLCQTSCKFKTSSLPKVDVHLKDNSSKLGEELKVKSKLQTNRALTELSVTSLKNKLNNNVNLVTQRGNERNSSNLSISPNYLFISEFNSTNTNIKKEKVGKRKISENLFCSNSTQKNGKEGNIFKHDIQFYTKC